MTFLFGHLQDRDYLLNLISDFLSKTKTRQFLKVNVLHIKEENANKMIKDQIDTDTVSKILIFKFCYIFKPSLQHYLIFLNIRFNISLYYHISCA